MIITKEAILKTVIGRASLPVTVSVSREIHTYDRAEQLLAEAKLENFLAEAAAVLGQAWANHTGDAVRVQVGSRLPYTIGAEMEDD